MVHGEVSPETPAQLGSLNGEGAWAILLGGISLSLFRVVGFSLFCRASALAVDARCNQKLDVDNPIAVLAVLVLENEKWVDGTRENSIEFSVIELR